MRVVVFLIESGGCSGGCSDGVFLMLYFFFKWLNLLIGGWVSIGYEEEIFKG